MASRARRLALYFAHRRLGHKWARALARANVSPFPSQPSSNGRIRLPGLGIELSAPDELAVALCRMARQCESLHRLEGAQFEIEADRILVSLPGLTGFSWNAADLGVWAEVFGERLYEHLGEPPDVVVDIGANIGVSVLYFALAYKCPVHAFELVPSTAALARLNIAANPRLAELINLLAIGLSNESGRFEVPVDPELRPSNSLHVQLDRASARLESATVEPASALLEPILASSHRAMLKLDAEGAEYEILENLEAAGLLAQFSIIHLEWHRRDGRDPAELRERLSRSGFQWFERRHEHAPVGFVSAYRLI